jgi:hypothetical protein
MDQASVKKAPTAIPLPASASGLFQLISSQPSGHGVSLKVKTSSMEPMLKVREKGPKPIRKEADNGLLVHLQGLCQKLPGLDDAESAAKDIKALLAQEKLKLSAGMLVGPLAKLSKAEQAFFAQCNSFVKRWIANESMVQSIVNSSADHGDEAGEKAKSNNESLAAACRLLARFPNTVNGEIDTNVIMKEAFAIGRALTREEINRLGVARFVVTAKSAKLKDYIGPEVALLLDLCLRANTETQEDEFRKDDQTKNIVAGIAQAMRARTDNDEYHVPESPRTVAERSRVRSSSSIPVFRALPDSASTETGQIRSPENPDKDDARRTPRKSDSSAMAALSTSFPASSAIHSPTGQGGKPPVSPRVPGLDMSATMRETQEKGQEKPRRSLRKVKTVNDARASTGGMPKPSSSALSVSNADRPDADEISSTTPRRKKQLNASTQGGTPFKDETKGEQRYKASEADKTETESRAREGRKTRQVSNTKEDEAPQEKTGRKPPVPASRRQPRTSQPESLDLKKIFSTPEFQQGWEQLKSSPPDPEPGRLQPRTDSEVYKQWIAVEEKEQPSLTEECKKAARKFLSFCHSIEQDPAGLPSALGKVMHTARLHTSEMKALVAVRDLVIKDFELGPDSRIAQTFPRLLRLLVLLIDLEVQKRHARGRKLFF